MVLGLISIRRLFRYLAAFTEENALYIGHRSPASPPFSPTHFLGFFREIRVMRVIRVMISLTALDDHFFLHTSDLLRDGTARTPPANQCSRVSDAALVGWIVSRDHARLQSQ